jgi:hypothetical protein
LAERGRGAERCAVGFRRHGERGACRPNAGCLPLPVVERAPTIELDVAPQIYLVRGLRRLTRGLQVLRLLYNQRRHGPRRFRECVSASLMRAREARARSSSLLPVHSLSATVKVIVVGNGGVGKSSMTARYCKGVYTTTYKKTIGALRARAHAVRLPRARSTLTPPSLPQASTSSRRRSTSTTASR